MLSQNSMQGSQQFKNEVVLVAKLQHRNLVRLLGFCLKAGEKLLVYEYVPIDYFPFDPEKSRLLDWPTRMKIISAEMNPKISNFGMAGPLAVIKLRRTRPESSMFPSGYMSPEYVMCGHFSGKSDMYSCGVLVLEIISGKRNNSYFQETVWKHWRDDTLLKVVDIVLGESNSRDEVLRCLHISLVCVPKDPADRPTMKDINIMLGSYTIKLPIPLEPVFFLRSRTRSVKSRELESDRSLTMPSSVNDASLTEVYPR